MPTTWDPAHKDTFQTLSGGNLVATSSAGSGTVNSCVYATTAISPTIKQYFEVTATGTLGQYLSIGVMNGSASLSANIAATNGASFLNNGRGSNQSCIYLNATQYDDIFRVLASGQVVRVAIDRGANRCWWAINNNTWSGSNVWMDGSGSACDPNTGTGGLNISVVSGTIYPAISSAWTGDVATLNAGATAFAYAVPTGFVGIDSGAVGGGQARALVLA